MILYTLVHQTNNEYNMIKKDNLRYDSLICHIILIKQIKLRRDHLMTDSISHFTAQTEPPTRLCGRFRENSLPLLMCPRSLSLSEGADL